MINTKNININNNTSNEVVLNNNEVKAKAIALKQYQKESIKQLKDFLNDNTINDTNNNNNTPKNKTSLTQAEVDLILNYDNDFNTLKENIFKKYNEVLQAEKDNSDKDYCNLDYRTRQAINDKIKYNNYILVLKDLKDFIKPYFDIMIEKSFCKFVNADEQDTQQETEQDNTQEPEQAEVKDTKNNITQITYKKEIHLFLNETKQFFKNFKYHLCLDIEKIYESNTYINQLTGEDNREIAYTTKKLNHIPQAFLISKKDLFTLTNKNRIFLTLPTGAGKTTIISNLIKEITKENEKKQEKDLLFDNSLNNNTTNNNNNKRINFIVYKDDLLLQSVLSFNKSNIIPAINKSKVKEITKQGGKVVAYNNTTTNNSNNENNILNNTTINNHNNIFIGNIQGKVPDCDIIIIDEAHRTGATGYENYLLNNVEKIIIGMSATPYRNDGKTMSNYYNKEINNYTLAKHLTSINTPTLKYFVSKENINISMQFSDSNETNDFKIINNYTDYEINKIEYIFKKTQGQSNLIFTDKVENAIIINRYLKKKGYKSDLIIGNDEVMRQEQETTTLNTITNKLEYNNSLDIINKFKNKEIDFIVSVNKMLYGTDCPNTDNLIILRPTRSINLFTQMLGRALRLGAEQEVNVYDCCNLIEIQNELKHFNLFFTKQAPYYDFDNSMEKLTRNESQRLKALATRQYEKTGRYKATGNNTKSNNDHIIDNYVNTEYDNYFEIKFLNDLKDYNFYINERDDIDNTNKTTSPVNTNNFLKEIQAINEYDFLQDEVEYQNKRTGETKKHIYSYIDNIHDYTERTIKVKNNNIVYSLQSLKRQLDTLKKDISSYLKESKFYNAKTINKDKTRQFLKDNTTRLLKMKAYLKGEVEKEQEQAEVKETPTNQTIKTLSQIIKQPAEVKQPIQPEVKPQETTTIQASLFDFNNIQLDIKIDKSKKMTKKVIDKIQQATDKQNQTIATLQNEIERLKAQIQGQADIRTQADTQAREQTQSNNEQNTQLQSNTENNTEQQITFTQQEQQQITIVKQQQNIRNFIKQIIDLQQQAKSDITEHNKEIENLKEQIKQAQQETQQFRKRLISFKSNIRGQEQAETNTHNNLIYKQQA
ncbi:MAG: hypothetical protein Ta2D_10240 [Rickettsiales bacterium]|nr:MAG: hypothetical protein Ta2D_10240 [Rickettsiales bacterium]